MCDITRHQIDVTGNSRCSALAFITHANGMALVIAAGVSVSWSTVLSENIQ